MIIEPLNDSAITMANQNLDDFPALKHYWQVDTTDPDSYDETSKTITDAVAGCVVTCTSLTSGAAGVCTPEKASGTGSFSGTLASPGTDDVMIIMTGNLGTAGTDDGIGIGMDAGGTPSGAGFWFGAATNLSKISDGTNTDASGAGFGAGASVRVMTVDFSGNMNLYLGSGAAWTLANSAAVSNVSGGISAVTQDMTFDNIVNMSSLAILYFSDGLPSANSIEAGCLWMFDQATNKQNKVIYPGWAGMS